MRVAIEEAAEATVLRQGFEDQTPEERFADLYERVFQEIKETYGDKKIAFVCGIISGDGDEEIDANIVRLISWRTIIQEELTKKQTDLPTCTSAFIFSEIVYEKSGAFSLPRRERELLFQEFYRRFLRSGIVSHIFVTPGYENSEGTLDEIRTSYEEGIEVIFVDYDKPLGDLLDS